MIDALVAGGTKPGYGLRVKSDLRVSGALVSATLDG
jgi:hypothetical protein